MTNRNAMPDTAPLPSAPTAPVRYDPAFEVAEEGEAETTAELIESLQKIAEKTFADSGHALRGEHMAKLSIAPVSPGLVALTEAKVDLDGKPNGLREALAAHIARDGGEWEVRIQLCTDIEKMPIEDASAEWPQALSPYVAVARIVAPPQDAVAADDGGFGDDRIAFSPWHGIAAHRPIGSIMRVRKTVYDASKNFRATANRCPINEPRSA